MPRLLRIVLMPFFTALGVELGGSFVGSIPSVVTTGRPMRAIYELSQELKIWAIVVAIGGTFPAIEVIQTGIFQRSLNPVIKELIAVVFAFAGTFAGEWLICVITGNRR